MSDVFAAVEKLGFSPRLPRYTSYPTALEFRAISDKAHLSEEFKDSIRQVKHLSLYVHIPFCPSLCYFCACNKIITRDEYRKSSYISLLKVDAAQLRSALADDQQIVQVHLGGGSPSFLSLEHMQELLEVLEQFKCTDRADRSIEIDPRTFTTENLKLLYQAGFRRFSVGVQDFDPQVQKLINRTQSHEMTVNIISAIRAYPNTKVNIDLIYGLPGQTLESFSQTVDSINVIRPDRLAIYGYAHVKWKVKVQNVFEKYPLPTPSERRALFECAYRQLSAAGYKPIGLDHFGLPYDELVQAQNKRTLRRNFMGYSVDPGESMVALGISAIADSGDFIIQNSLEESDYSNSLSRGEFPFQRFIKRSQDDKIRSFLIESLMCNCHLSLRALQERFPTDDVVPLYSQGVKLLHDMEKLGLVEIASDEICVPEIGRLFLRHIVSRFDAYLEGAIAHGTNRFSAAI